MQRKRTTVWIGIAALLAGCGQQPTTPTAKKDAPAPTAATGKDKLPTPTAQGVEKGEPVDPTKAAKAGEPIEVALDAIFVLPAADKSGAKLTAAEIDKFLADPANHQTILPKSPIGLESVAKYVPADNPMTRAKVELGRMLYFDGRLSRDNTVSCASCHAPDKGWTDNAPVSTGINGQKGGRSAPTVMNRVFGKTQFWDGRAASLEEQALGPIQNPIEMGFTHDEAVARLKGIEGYQKLFTKVFGGVSKDAIGKAIATFERTVLVGGSPNDYLDAAKSVLKITPEDLAELDDAGKKRVETLLANVKAHPISESASRGRELYFGRAECSLCHVGYNLTDELFYNLGVGMNQKDPDKGRTVVSKDPKDLGAFKTPTLRNIKSSAPYMHDGSQKTLLEVVQWYNQGGHPNPTLHTRVKKLNLKEQEMKDIVAFMEEGLTSPLPNIVAPRLP